MRQVQAQPIGFLKGFPLLIAYQAFLRQAQHAGVKPQHKHQPGLAQQQLTQAPHLHTVLLGRKGGQLGFRQPRRQPLGEAVHGDALLTQQLIHLLK